MSGQRSILIVEDEPLIAMMLEDFLETLGHRVVASCDTVDAALGHVEVGGFDVAISRGGVMFFADPVAAFGNIRRALRPGGRLALVCPRAVNPEDDFARALRPLWAAMREHGPASDAADSDPGPTSLADADRIDEVLTVAGFSDITTTAITVPMVFGRDAADAAGFFLAMGPMRFNLASADAAASGKPVTGVAVSTVAPSAWPVTPHSRAGVRTFALASPGAKLDVVDMTPPYAGLPHFFGSHCGG